MPITTLLSAEDKDQYRNPQLVKIHRDTQPQWIYLQHNRYAQTSEKNVEEGMGRF